MLRVNGSHYIYGILGNAQKIFIPTHDNKALKTGLLKHFLKVSGISEDEL